MKVPNVQDKEFCLTFEFEFETFKLKVVDFCRRQFFWSSSLFHIQTRKIYGVCCMLYTKDAMPASISTGLSASRKPNPSMEINIVF